MQLISKEIIREITSIPFFHLMLDDDRYKAHTISHIDWEMPTEDLQKVQKSLKRRKLSKQDSKESLENFKLE